MKQLDVDEDVATILVQEGFSTHRGDRVRTGVRARRHRGVHEEIVKELRNRARDVLITQAIVSEEIIDQAEPAEDFEPRGHGQGARLELAAAAS